MIALADFSILLLGTSALVLAASIALMSIRLPSIGWWRRFVRSRRRPSPIRATHRRISSGRPSPLSPLALPPAAPTRGPHRQHARSRDIHGRHDELLEAEATIEHLLDIDPERIARLMMNWINEVDTDRTVDDRR